MRSQTAGSISVVIIDSSADSINGMVNYIKGLENQVRVEGAAANFDSGFELIHKKRPSVVIMEAENKGGGSVGRIDAILGRFPKTAIFVTSEDKDAETILKFMRAGAAEYLPRPVREEDLGSALRKLGRLQTAKPAEEQIGRIYTVFSPKGGVGVTTIAINLATGVYEATRQRTLLVDLDLNAGDISTFLNLKPAYTISDVTANIARLDRSFLEGVITKHESGIFVLAEPQMVEEGVSIPGADLRKVLGLFKMMFTHIVIDTEPVFDGRTMTAIEMSDTILLTCIMSLPGIKNIQRYLNYLGRLGYGKDRVRLLVNRYLKKGNIKLGDAEKVLNYPIFFSIPNDYDSAMSCLNRGEPVNTCAPKSQLNLSIRELARSVIGIGRVEV